MLNYSGNLVLSAPSMSSLVPYVTGGVGGMTMLETKQLQIRDVETFLTGNVGGGGKWYAGRWGLRADYRFTRSNRKTTHLPSGAMRIGLATASTAR